MLSSLPYLDIREEYSVSYRKSEKEEEKKTEMPCTNGKLSTTCRHFAYIALWWLLDFKKLQLSYSAPNSVVQTFTDLDLL